MTETVDIPEYPTPRDAKCPFLPPPELRELHTAGLPLSRVRTWDGRTPWLIASHAAQRQVMADPRVSANDHLPGFPYMTPAIAETIHDRPKTLFDTDGPEHARLRRMLTNSFTRGRMEKVRPAIQRVTDDLIDKMLAGPNPTDLVEALSLPLPSLMICELLGVPYEDHDFFEAHAKITNGREVTPEENNASNAALGAYLGKLIVAKMEKPEEDVVSDLAARVKAGELDMPGATIMSMIMLIAGHETSANMITLATALLLENPDQLALLRETEDKKVIAGAVEELLRYLTIPHLLQRRIATEDIEVEGQTIRAGRASSVRCPRPISTRWPSLSPTSWISCARRATTMRSAGAHTSASASSSRASNSRSYSAPSTVASRRCGWESTSTSCGSRVIRSPTASTNCRLPGSD